jgi:peptidoglycan glycosyltransferase
VQDYFTSLTNDPNQPNLARAYRDRYPPGSTFKTVTASVALETGAATPQTQFPFLRQLTLPQTTNVLKNFGGETCGGTLVASFTQSCNTTFGQIGLNLGDRLPAGADRFGINDTPPLDVSPGAVGSIGPLAGTFQNNQPLFAFAGIGQGDVATTPLEMALIAAGIANGGVIMAPHAVGEIRDSNNKLVRKIDAGTWKTAMSPATAQAVTSMMVQVVQSGTGTGAQISGVTVAGKTGTAEVANGNPHAWFIGFAPAEAPQIVVAVIVEHGGNANSEITGGRIAAPIAKQVIQAALGR